MYSKDDDGSKAQDPSQCVSAQINSCDLLRRLINNYVDGLDADLQAEHKSKNIDSPGLSLHERLCVDACSPSNMTSSGDTPSEFPTTDRLRNLLARPAWGTQATWFVGPGGENLDELSQLCNTLFTIHKEFRTDSVDAPFTKESGGYDAFIEGVQNSDDYKQGMALLEEKLKLLVNILSKGSVPFQRFSYIAHMNWDNTLPGVLGWVVGVLYNQNNVAAEASPVTTVLEIDLSRQLCRMMGFANTPPPVSLGEPDRYTADHSHENTAIPWGKITCDGSVANIESVWMARNYRYFCLACQTTLFEEPLLTNLKFHNDAKIIPTGASEERYFVDLTSWEIVNLIPERFFDLLDRVARLLSPETASDNAKGHALLHGLIEKRDLRSLGMVEFAQQYPVVRHSPKVVISATRHYSWPKAVTVLGLGSSSLVGVPVGSNGRMDMAAFDRKISEIVDKKVPVLLAVSVHGSTVEGAVDNLHEMLEIRERYRAKGVDFLVHVDAAWGGYFQALQQSPPSTSLTQPSAEKGASVLAVNDQRTDPYVAAFGGRKEAPISRLKPSVQPAFSALKNADTITIDPHKSGFVPYPAGGLLVRDSRLRERIAVRAPIVFKGKSDPTVSWYGLEGSRAGAAAVATWFSHLMIPLDKQGYGELLGRCLFNSTMLYAALHYMALKSRNPDSVDTAYFVTTIPAIDKSSDDFEYFIERLVTEPLEVLKLIVEPEDIQTVDRRDRKFREFFDELGSDTAIIAYAFTPAQYIDGEFVPNSDVGLSNLLNRELYNKFSLLEYLPDQDGKQSIPDLFLSSTEYDESIHGIEFLDQLKAEMQVTGSNSVAALVTTTMNPWFLDTPDVEPKYPSSPFPRRDMISHIMGILDHSVKNMIRQIS